jgi:spermidine synthase
VASRVIAPSFGNSVYVWGSLIGVFLAALSAGYYLGGIVADRRPSGAVFAGLVFLAGVLVFPIPLFAPRVLDAIVFADYGPRIGPLAAVVALFFLPSLVMGMVSPFAVRLRARTVTTIGNVAGILYALSTLGSIAGTLLAAFVLIASMRVSTIIHLLGGLMMAMALVGWLAARRLRIVAGAALITALLVSVPVLIGPAQGNPGQVFREDTVYHRISVTDEYGIRYLRLDNYWQSGMELADPRRTVFPYSDYLHLPLALRPHAARVLLVGLGGGTVPKRFHEDYPKMRIEVVELDPAIVTVARRYFGVPAEDARMHIVAEDGRLFITRSADRYDVILLDAYLIDTIPFHLATREFFETAKRRLTPSGVLASNVIGALDGPRSAFFRAVYRTFASVFRTVYVFPVDWARYDGAESLRNIIIIGTDQPALPRAQFAAAAAAAAAALPITVEGFTRAAADQYILPVPTSDVPVLTDDFAPVELLIQPR